MDNEELEIWRALNKLPEVKEVFGEWDYGDTYCNCHGFLGHFPVANGTWDYTNDGWKFAIWIPPIYDPIRPERSLWHLSGDIRWHWSVSERLQFTFDARPDLALAKAILEQEGK